MQWIAPPEKDTATDTPEKRLWEAADQSRGDSGLKPQECSGAALGLIFLRSAGVGLAAQRIKLEKDRSSERELRRRFVEHRT